MESLLPASFWPSVHELTTGESWPPGAPASATRFIEGCSRHGLLPLLFAETELPPVVRQARDSAMGWKRILSTRARLFHDATVAVCEFFHDEPIVLMKDADYAHRLYPDPSLRPMADIDVLVQAPRFESVCQRVLDAGWVEQPTTAVQRDKTYNERTFQFGAFFVDVHRAFIQRSRHQIDYDAIWRRRHSRCHS